MPSIDIGATPYKIIGNAACVGGAVGPEPPICGYPLLAWVPKYRGSGPAVICETGTASVHDVACAAASGLPPAAIAAKYRLTDAHVRQALDYAIEAGCLA